MHTVNYHILFLTVEDTDVSLDGATTGRRGYDLGQVSALYSMRPKLKVCFVGLKTLIIIEKIPPH